MNAEVDKILEAAIYFYSNPVINAGSSFEMIGDIFKILNGATINWKRTIGEHAVYAHVRVNHNIHSKKVGLIITFVTEDIYNFNVGQHDLDWHVPDAINGRFAVLGWAKEFKTYGSFVLMVER